jgi:hypothetical protein
MYLIKITSDKLIIKKEELREIPQLRVNLEVLSWNNITIIVILKLYLRRKKAFEKSLFGMEQCNTKGKER